MRAALSFLLAEVLTLTAAGAAAATLYRFVPRAVVTAPRELAPLNAGTYFPVPAEGPWASRAALERALRAGDAVVFGSSEMTAGSDAIFHKLYPAACGRSVLTFGKAGFQSLPILLTLAHARAALSARANVWIILSPVWFAERGTPSSSFLKNLSPFEIPELLRQPDVPPQISEALAREIRVRRDEFTGIYPDWLFATAPWFARFALDRGTTAATPPATVRAAPPAPEHFDWDALEARYRAELLAKSEGNPIGTTAEYYNRIKKYHPPYPGARLDPWRIERRDVLALSSLLKEYGVRAHFVLQPIHRRVYGPLDHYDRLLDEVEARLKSDGHTFDNYFREPFDLGTLKDAGHFSDAYLVKLQREMCNRG